jgi:hypothetical protein
MRHDQQFSALGPSFCRERMLLSAELANMSRSVPSIRSRLEGLARIYRQRSINLQHGSQECPPLTPGRCDDGTLRSTG